MPKSKFKAGKKCTEFIFNEYVDCSCMRGILSLIGNRLFCAIFVGAIIGCTCSLLWYYLEQFHQFLFLLIFFRIFFYCLSLCQSLVIKQENYSLSIYNYLQLLQSFLPEYWLECRELSELLTPCLLRAYLNIYLGGLFAKFKALYSLYTAQFALCQSFH